MLRGAPHAPDAFARPGVASFELASLRQLEILEFEAGRDGATDQAVGGVGRELGAEPRPRWNDQLGALSRPQIHAEHGDVPAAIGEEPEHFERSAFVEVEDFVGRETMQVRVRLRRGDQEIDRSGGRALSRPSRGFDALAGAVCFDEVTALGVRGQTEDVDNLAVSLCGASEHRRSVLSLR